MPAVPGVRLAAGACGIRYKGRTDLMFCAFGPGTSVAGVFTRNAVVGAPVKWCRKILPAGRARGLVVNSGNANVFTGERGDRALARTAEAAAGLLGCAPEEVFVCSTGVIGEPPNADKIVTALPALEKELGGDGWEAAARAIMTTDTFPKGTHRTARIGDAEVSVCGIAKGSGMIAPDMATMLCYVFTDARIPAPVLQDLLAEAVGRSFNCVTVDSDTSTSDTVLLFATGAGADHPEITDATAPELADFREKLDAACLDLAHQVVRDGEGATKFVEIGVTGAKDEASARRIGLSIANSPLVKTAITASDANWGRIAMAIGKAGEPVDADRVSIRVGGVTIAAEGGVVEGYDEAPVASHMAGTDIAIEVDVGVGGGRATVWTCDLSHDYISINADYRT